MKREPPKQPAPQPEEPEGSLIRKGKMRRSLPMTSVGYGIRRDEYSYLFFRRRINSAAPNPPRPIASNPRLNGSGTVIMLIVGMAKACIGTSKMVATKTNLIAAPPSSGWRKSSIFYSWRGTA
jgi:hypothetical protein